MHPAILQFVPFERVHAAAMLSWKYASPYEIYNAPEPWSEETVAQLLQPDLHYVAVLDERDEMIAFRCFGSDAQVLGGDYREEALDLGGGIRPDLTGQGLGKHVISAAMRYAVERFHSPLFRTTVATFNARARKTCERLGYRVVSSFARPTDGLQFAIMLQDARVPDLSIPMVVKKPNKAPEPTRGSVTPHAAHEPRHP